MATITKKRLKDTQSFATPYGNVTSLAFSLVSNASGAAVNSDVTAAIGLGDVVRIGILPAGFRLNDSLTIVSDAFTALVTGSIGFAYMDGVDDATVPQDADYFGAGVTMAVAGRYPASNVTVRPVTLPKDAWLTVTTAGAANAAVGIMDVIVKGEMVGV